MDTRIQVGQRLCTGFPGTRMDDAFVRQVRENKIGNVILFRHNVTDSSQLRALCADIQALITEETGHPALISMDQEGGSVSRLPEDAAVFPAAMAVAATQNPQNAYDAGLYTGMALRARGVNLNLAPVMDISNNPANPVIGVRSFGDSPERAALFGARMIEGHLDAGVLCAAKHFPGHGDTAVDSHVGLPRVDKTLEDLMACELFSFQAAIRAGVPAVMAAHILYPRLEPDFVPATMSRRIITGLLREQMGFSGLVLSDCMMMGAIADHYSVAEGCLKAANAGVDVIFVSHSAGLAGEAASLMRAALADGRLGRAEMAASVGRILAAKRSLQPALLDERDLQAHQAAARMTREAVTWVRRPDGGAPTLGETPLFAGCPPYQADNASDPARGRFTFPAFMAELLGGDAVHFSAEPGEAEIRSVIGRVPGHSCVVLGTVNAHLHPGQTRLMRALAETEVPLICVALRNPYDLAALPPRASALCVYGYDPESVRAAAEVLSGNTEALGRLPVSL